MSIVNGFYWRILVNEQHIEKWPCVEAALSPLRRYIYRMVLAPEKHCVLEYGRGCEQKFEVVKVDVSEVRVINLQEVQEENRKENLETFHYIMTHVERDDADKVYELRNPDYKTDFNSFLSVDEETDGDIENYFQHHDEHAAFTMYLLRYMVVLNWRQNLCVGDREFLALMAVVLREANDARYQRLNRCPRPETVTIANWFLDIYRHAYSFLARPLYLTHHFPQPKHIFCGSAWIAFHACCRNENDGADDLNDARSEIRAVLLGNRGIVERVARGYIRFDPDNPFVEQVTEQLSMFENMIKGFADVL